jgi:hypothetical protein
MQKTRTVITTLVGGYIVISLGAVVALYIMRTNTEFASKEAWVHGVIIAITAIIMGILTRLAVMGNAKSYLRLRITTLILLFAIIATTAIPGDFPIWMKTEQVVSGLLLLGVVALLNHRKTRLAFK